MTRASGQQAAAEETVQRLWLALGHSSPPDLVPWEMQQLREVENVTLPMLALWLDLSRSATPGDAHLVSRLDVH